MNRIVKEHYPAERLPEDLREGLGADTLVRVSIEVEAKPVRRTRDLVETIMRSKADGKWPLAVDDPVARIRKLRDEWDD
jgi:hypothetical protein